MLGLMEMAPGRRRVRRWRWALTALVLIGATYASRAVWLRQIGAFLVVGVAPQPAEVAVVLAGDGYGHRILKAVELFQQGYVKQVVVDGPRGWYDFDEASLAIRFAVDRGAPKEIFVPLRIQARSTVAEARVLDETLLKWNMRKALIVTSNYHTRRTRSIFRRFGSPHIRYVIVAAPDEDFQPEDWWRSRDAQKVLVMEYIKLFHWWVMRD